MAILHGSVRGRPDGCRRASAGAPGYACPTIEEIFDKTANDDVLDPNHPSTIGYLSNGSAAMIYNGVFCQRRVGQSMEDYVEEQEKAEAAAKQFLKS